MSNVIVHQGQTLFDIAVQESGNVAAVFDWALKNNKSITEELVTGEILENPESIYTEIAVTNYFKTNNSKPATAITKQNHELIVADEGIGAMIIENTFIVG
jgi:hypothetical protein